MGLEAFRESPVWGRSGTVVHLGSCPESQAAHAPTRKLSQAPAASLSPSHRQALQGPTLRGASPLGIVAYILRSLRAPQCWLFVESRSG